MAEFKTQGTRTVENRPTPRDPEDRPAPADDKDAQREKNLDKTWPIPFRPVILLPQSLTRAEMRGDSL